MLSLNWDQSSLDAELDQLLEANDAAVRPAAQAGAQVYYEGMHMRVPVGKETRVVKGKTYAPGTLKAALYQKYSEDNSGKGRAEYHVSWNAKKAPHGHLIENGHWLTQWGSTVFKQPVWVPPQSFVRATFDADGPRALEAVWQEYQRRVKEMIQ